MVDRDNKSAIFLNQLTRENSHKLFKNIAMWLCENKVVELDLNGTPDQMLVIKEAIMASKRFQDELSNPAANLETITERLRSKHSAANRFQETFGLQWPL